MLRIFRRPADRRLDSNGSPAFSPRSTDGCRSPRRGSRRSTGTDATRSSGGLPAARFCRSSPRSPARSGVGRSGISRSRRKRSAGSRCPVGPSASCLPPIRSSPTTWRGYLALRLDEAIAKNGARHRRQKSAMSDALRARALRPPRRPCREPEKVLVHGDYLSGQRAPRSTGPRSRAWSISASSRWSAIPSSTAPARRSSSK